MVHARTQPHTEKLTVETISHGRPLIGCYFRIPVCHLGDWEFCSLPPYFQSYCGVRDTTSNLDVGRTYKRSRSVPYPTVQYAPIDSSCVMKVTDGQ